MESIIKLYWSFDHRQIDQESWAQLTDHRKEVCFDKSNYALLSWPTDKKRTIKYPTQLIQRQSACQEQTRDASERASEREREERKARKDWWVWLIHLAHRVQSCCSSSTDSVLLLSIISLFAKSPFSEDRRKTSYLLLPPLLVSATHSQCWSLGQVHPCVGKSAGKKAMKKKRSKRNAHSGLCTSLRAGVSCEKTAHLGWGYRKVF